MSGFLLKCWIVNKITEKQFDMMAANYETEQAELEQRIADGRQELDTYLQDEERIDKFLELTKRYTDFTELTTPMLKEFVEKIVVHAPDRSTGQRTQQVDICFKFIGQFSIPKETEQLSPEEQIVRDELEAKRAEYRRKYQRRKELKAQHKQEAKALRPDVDSVQAELDEQKQFAIGYARSLLMRCPAARKAALLCYERISRHLRMRIN